MLPHMKMIQFQMLKQENTQREDSERFKARENTFMFSSLFDNSSVYLSHHYVESDHTQRPICNKQIPLTAYIAIMLMILMS